MEFHPSLVSSFVIAKLSAVKMKRGTWQLTKPYLSYHSIIIKADVAYLSTVVDSAKRETALDLVIAERRYIEARHM